MITIVCSIPSILVTVKAVDYIVESVTGVWSLCIVCSYNEKKQRATR